MGTLTLPGLEAIHMKKAQITMENGNVIELELYDQEAPGTVANFEKLANEGFYNGLSFHRVIPGFVAQGGCPYGTGTGGPGYTIKCETKGNPHKHLRGALSMAHAGKDTGGSQFFICYDSFPHLDGVHTVFGKITSGMEHVDAIKQGDKMGTVKVTAE
jgi:peptidyl-prolyl cis-trans isomerase B (cyclophilin B)